MKKLNNLFLALLILAPIPATCLAQCVVRTIPISRVEGTVVDPSGEPIPNVEVNLKQDGKVISSITADEAGRFSLSVSPGNYDLNANARGFVPGFARIDVGHDAVRLFKSTHLWMILVVGMLEDHCTFTTTSRRKFEKAIQEHKKRN